MYIISLNLLKTGVTNTKFREGRWIAQVYMETIRSRFPHFPHSMLSAALSLSFCLKQPWWAAHLLTLAQFIWQQNNNISKFLDKFQYSFSKKGGWGDHRFAWNNLISAFILQMRKARARGAEKLCQCPFSSWRSTGNEVTCLTPRAEEWAFCSPGLPPSYLITPWFIPSPPKLTGNSLLRAVWVVWLQIPQGHKDGHTDFLG